MRSCLPLNTPARSLAETIQVQNVGKERTQAGTQARPHTSRKKDVKFIPTQQQVRWSRRLSDAVSPVESGANVPGAEDAADSRADTLSRTQGAGRRRGGC